jgi:hypothetical protein
LLMFIEVQEYQDFGFVVDSQRFFLDLWHKCRQFKKKFGEKVLFILLLSYGCKKLQMCFNMVAHRKTQVFHLGYINATHF